MEEEIGKIIDGLNQKATLKQTVYKATLRHFEAFKKAAFHVIEEIAPKILDDDHTVEVKLTEHGTFEFHLKFSGDTIVFLMHTNVFAFPPEHETNQSKHVKENPQRGYFGMIQIYNFLSDSIKYNRNQDVGYQLARVFINAADHFYVDGQRQLDFLYKDVDKNVIKKEIIETIIEQCMTYCLDFDLFVPPVETFAAITIDQKNYFNGSKGLPTGKRLGFKSES